MHISFSGVIAPYTYNCPYAHKLRNILKLKIPKKEESSAEEQAEDQSRRQRGIELHQKLSDYLKNIEDSFNFTTSTIENVKSRLQPENIFGVEHTFYFDEMFNPLKEIPENKNEDFISLTPDLFIINKDGSADLYDWKFANSEFGIARHYDELSFFLSGLISKFVAVYEWRIHIHFPEEDYTLPIRTYNFSSAARIQFNMQNRIDKILTDKQLKATPSKARCYFCDRRSEDTGGSGQCDLSMR